MATNSVKIAKTGKFGDLRNRLVFLLLALVVYRVGAHSGSRDRPKSIERTVQGPARRNIEPVQYVLWWRSVTIHGICLGYHAVYLGFHHHATAHLCGSHIRANEKEGEAGRRKITQYTRYGTLGLALFQSMGIAVALESSPGLVLDPGFGFRMTAVFSLTAGTMCF